MSESAEDRKARRRRHRHGSKPEPQVYMTQSTRDKFAIERRRKLNEWLLVAAVIVGIGLVFWVMHLRANR